MSLWLAIHQFLKTLWSPYQCTLKQLGSDGNAVKLLRWSLFKHFSLPYFYFVLHLCFCSVRTHYKGRLFLSFPGKILVLFSYMFELEVAYMFWLARLQFFSFYKNLHEYVVMFLNTFCLLSDNSFNVHFCLRRLIS